MRFFILCLIFGCAIAQSTDHDIPTYVERFLMVGDWGSSSRTAANNVSRAMNEWAEKNGGIDFILSVGDNFYDGPNSVNDSKFHDRWLNTYTGDAIKDKLWFISTGNHDYYDYKGQEEYEVARTYMKNETKWYLPHYWYKRFFDSPVGRVRLVVADSQAARKDLHRGREFQYPWFEDEVFEAMVEGDWLLPVAHHPCYTAGNHFPGSSTICTNFLSVLEYYGAPLFIHGHDHNMQHLQKKDGLDKLDMIIVGGGGASTYGQDPRAEAELGRQGVEIKEFFPKHGFASVEFGSFDDGEMRITFYDTGELKPLYRISYGRDSDGKVRQVGTRTF